jgi:peptidoglycan/xylan/chitin deacetylase (PgdA/CDA1 family)
MLRWRNPTMRRFSTLLEYSKLLDRIQPWLSGLGLIFMFHHVVAPGRPVFDAGLNVYSDDLDRMLGYIRYRGWDIVTIDELHARLKNGASGRPFVCFTFDDGYADNLGVALPIFRRHEAPFCIYAAVGYVDRTTPGWWDALGEALLQRDYVELSRGGRVERIELATWDEKVKAYERLGRAMYEDVLARRSPLGSTWIRNGLDPMALSDPSFMTWKQLQEIALDPLVQIGAHTVTHPSLANLSEREAGHEIEQSKRILERKLGVRISHFAYPFGGYENCGAREFGLARGLGFTTAVTTRSSNIFSADKEHVMSLPRKSMRADDAGLEAVRGRLYGENLSLKLLQPIPMSRG